MNNRRQVINLIKTVSGQANVLTIPRIFVSFVGSLDGALLLSQIIYWSDKTDGSEGWFYKTYPEWQDEICLSEYEVRQNARKLVEKGILATKVKKAPNGNPTVHYRLDWDKFSDSFLKFLRERNPNNSGNEPEESSETLNTEITTESTAKNPGNSSHPAIKAYQQEMGRYPTKTHWPDIIEAVGEDEAHLLFWKQVVKGWKLTGWNPKNTGGMLEYFRRREIPSTKVMQQKGAQREGTSARAGQPDRLKAPAASGKSQTAEPINRTVLRTHLERKRKSG